MSFEIPPLPSEAVRPSPFTPTFGVMPPALAGRQPMINAFAAGLDGMPGNEYRAMFLTGQRGMGKTVMLNAFREVADSRQWATIYERTSEGLADRLTNTRIPALLDSLDTAPKARRTSITGISLPAGLGGVNTQTTETRSTTPDLRSRLDELLAILHEHGTGLVIALDEVHRSHLDELRAVTDAVQNAFMDSAPLAFVGAGLPTSINELVNDDVSTFLRRAARAELAPLEPHEVKDALRGPIEAAGRTITDEALDAAVEATQGWPYLTQLVGGRAWELAGQDRTIEASHVLAARESAQDALASRVIEPTIAGMSRREREYLVAVARIDGPAETGEIAARMEISPTNAGNYRARLLATGVLESPFYGHVQLSLPGLKEYLRENGSKLLAGTPYEAGDTGDRMSRFVTTTGSKGVDPAQLPNQAPPGVAGSRSSFPTTNPHEGAAPQSSGGRPTLPGQSPGQDGGVER